MTDGQLLLSLRGVALLSRVRSLAWAAAWVASLPRLLGVLDRDRLVDGEALPARSSCLAGPGTKRQAGRCSLSFLALPRWCLVLFFFGGDVIHNFALALVAGNFLGSFSTIAVAAPLVYEWEKYSGRR